MSFNFNDFLTTFISIIFEALPFIVIGAVISGALEELLPQQFFNKWLPKNRLIAIVLSATFGFILPMCECGIVAVMRRLLNKGVPVGCAIAYMLSAPIINPIVLSSTALAFWDTYNLQVALPGMSPLVFPGMGMVILRGFGAFVIAVTVGIIIDRMDRRGDKLVRDGSSRLRIVETDESARLRHEEGIEDSVPAKHEHGPDCSHEGHEHGPDCQHGHDHHHSHAHGHHHHHGHAHHHHHVHHRSALDRLKGIADIALGDFIDIACFLVIGAAIAATVNTALPRQQLDELSSHRSLAILAMMAFAVFVTLCSEADAFVAANFITLSTGAKVAFLVLGPMLDMKLLIMYRWVFTNRTIRVFVPILIVMAFLFGQAVDMLEMVGITFRQSTMGAGS